MGTEGALELNRPCLSYHHHGTMFRLVVADSDLKREAPDFMDFLLVGCRGLIESGYRARLAGTRLSASAAIRSMNGGQNAGSWLFTSGNLDGPGGGSWPSRIRTIQTATVARSMGSSGQKRPLPQSVPSKTPRPASASMLSRWALDEATSL